MVDSLMFLVNTLRPMDSIVTFPGNVDEMGALTKPNNAWFFEVNHVNHSKISYICIV